MKKYVFPILFVCWVAFIAVSIGCNGSTGTSLTSPHLSVVDPQTDIPMLADHFLHQVAERNEQTAPALSEAAMALMMDYPWPGNVRELQNAIQFAIVRCNNKVITAADLPMELRQLKIVPAKLGRIKKLDIQSVRDALVKTGGNKASAARELGVGRATLYRFLSDNAAIIESS